jgi:hypothetical protein
LASVPGVEARIADSMIDVSYVGDVDGIIKTLATFAVQSVESVGGELDEVLLDFYSDDRYAPKGGA